MSRLVKSLQLWNAGMLLSMVLLGAVGCKVPPQEATEQPPDVTQSESAEATAAPVDQPTGEAVQPKEPEAAEEPAAPVSQPAEGAAPSEAEEEPASQADQAADQELPFGWERLDSVFDLPGIKTEHYYFYSQMSDATTFDLAWRTESLYEYYAERFADEHSPIDFAKQVFLFSNREDYVAAGGHATMPGQFMGGFGDEVGARLMMITSDANFGALTMVTCPLLYHEGFHQFVAVEIAQAGNVNRTWPTWMDEGHGSLFFNIVWTGDGWVEGGLTVNYITSAVQNSPNFIPFEQMLTVSGAGWHQLLAEGRVWAVYMQSMSVLHFLYYANDGEHRELIETYVHQVSTSVNGEESKASAAKIIALEDEFLEWFKANMAMPDGTPNLRVTGAKYYETMAAMATSYFARAYARGQRFQSGADFMAQAAADTLELAPLGDWQWLPDTLRQEMVWWHEILTTNHGPIEIVIEQDGTDSPPALFVSQPKFGLILKGTFELDDEGNVADVNVEFVACPSVNLVEAEAIVAGDHDDSAE